MVFGYFILFLTVLSTFFISNLNADITVTILLKYTSNKTEPVPIRVTIPVNSTVLYAMSLAATENVRYRYGGTYYGTDWGWLIEKYDSVSNDLETHYCWYFYFELSRGKPSKPTEGVSNYLLSENETFVIFRYEFDEEYCKAFTKQVEVDIEVKSEL